MDITQSFYDEMATQYEKLFLDWQSTTREQAVILDRIFKDNGFDTKALVLDCACGIGTQSIGLASLGYQVSASDISDGELAEATARANNNGVRTPLSAPISATSRRRSGNSSTLSLPWTTLCLTCLQETTWNQQSRVFWGRPRAAVSLLPASVTMTASWRKSRHTPHLISTRRTKANGYLFRPGSGMRTDTTSFNTSLMMRNRFR